MFQVLQMAQLHDGEDKGVACRTLCVRKAHLYCAESRRLGGDLLEQLLVQITSTFKGTPCHWPILSRWPLVSLLPIQRKKSTLGNIKEFPTSS